MSTETLSTLGSLIGQQSGLVWSVAMAIVVAEIYIVCRFFESKSRQGLCSTLLLFGSIACHVLSLLAGYLTHGATIGMVRAAGAGNDKAAIESYEAAELMALLQFGFLLFGLLLFIVLFARNHIKVRNIIRSIASD